MGKKTMKALDTRGKLGPILSDPDRIIPKAHLEKVCKKDTGTCACRYIALSASGFVCVKNSSLQIIIDDQVKQGHFKATGDNCEGFGKYGKENIQESNKKKKKD